MREVGPDGAFYLRVGTQWVKVGTPSLNLVFWAVLLSLCEVCTAAAWQCKFSQIPNTTKFANMTQSSTAQKAWRHTCLHNNANCITAAQIFFQTSYEIQNVKIQCVSHAVQPVN